MPEVADIVKMPILGVCFVAISFISLTLNLPLLIPPFTATLFIIVAMSDSESSKVKAIVGGYLIAFALAFLFPVLNSFYNTTLLANFSFLNLIPDSLVPSILIGFTMVLAGWIMTITNTQHPAAIPTVMLFLNGIESSTLTFGFIPFQQMLGFGIGLGIVTAVSFLLARD